METSTLEITCCLPYFSIQINQWLLVPSRRLALGMFPLDVERKPAFVQTGIRIERWT
jgi:hypothetical protein